MRLEPLAKHHDREAFRCGQPELDEWLARFARQAQDRSGSARTQVLLTVDDVIAGYYSCLASITVARPSVPDLLARTLKFDQHGFEQR